MLIKDGDFENFKVIDLLRTHLTGMRENSPPESVYALDFSDLQKSEVSFWTAWENDTLLGCGALREISPTQGEIKSMRTQYEQLRIGVAAFILEHILAIAKQRSYEQLSLETGSGPAFEPAITLYKKYGFVTGQAFGDYDSSEFNQFLHLDMQA